MMKKQVFLLIALIALQAFFIPIQAQMSDEAVVSYIKDGISSGKSQDDLVRELALRGVTREQGERIRREYSGMSQVDNMAGGSSFQVSKDYRPGAYVYNMPLQDTNLIPGAKVTDGNQVFGRDIFSLNMLTFEPGDNLATPANYKLGPGDEIIIDIWGTNQTTIRQTISPDGFIKVDDVGLVYLGGMTIEEADKYMRRKLGRIYSVGEEDARSEIKLTLGALRTITVNVMGEVVVPGTYSLSSLSTVYHALYRAGGFSELGSVRNVSLVRNGKKIEVIDVYDFIVNGLPADNVVLQDGDVVLVPTYESVVAISGKVKRPMRYEMKKGENVADLIFFAGGFRGDAYTANVNVERRNGREYQVYTVESEAFPSFELLDGDSVRVGSTINRYENRLEIKGAVYRPGIYQLSEKVNTVSELIAVADGLRGDAFTNRALLHREREDLTLELIQVDLKGILDGSVADIELQRNDILTISNANEINNLGILRIMGEVKNPGEYKFAKNTTLEDLILQAGGLLESASTAKVDVSRRVKNPEETEDQDTISQLFSFSVDGDYRIKGGDTFVLEPYDYVYVRKSPGYSAQYHVHVQGEVVFSGSYALGNRSMRLSELVKLAGGVTSLAYVRGAKLNRKMTEVERRRFEATLDMVSNVKDSVNVHKLHSAENYSIGINLQEALDNPGGDADLVLREGDVLVVPEYINTVKISGNVLYPNTVSYDPKKTVKEFIEQAGGYGFDAKKNRAYIVYMNGTVAKAHKNSKAVVEPGCEIIVPEKRRKEYDLRNILSLASTSASLATMCATVYNILR